jgi:hypothetical protein
LGLFSRTTVVGNVLVDHYETGVIVVQNPFDWVHTIMVCALYLDRLAHDIGGLGGEVLWKRLFFLASDVHANVLRVESQQPLGERLFTPAIEYHAVTRSPGGDRLREKITLVEKSGHYFVECRTEPLTANEPERRLALGCEAMFVHFFNTGEPQQKLFLPVVIMAQCNWYQEHGIPTMSQITAAPYRGLALMQQLLSQGG